MKRCVRVPEAVYALLQLLRNARHKHRILALSIYSFLPFLTVKITKAGEVLIWIISRKEGGAFITQL